jgi:hypothetical protein
MKKITQSDLVRFVNLTGSARYYNEERKAEYRKLGKRILKELADLIGLKKGEFDIRWNPGGIACSGDHILHTDKVYVALHDNIGSGWFYWRTCQGRKDYTGGPNQIVAWTKLTAHGLEPLARILKVAQEGQYKDPSSGDIICDINMAIRMAHQAESAFHNR